MSQFLKTSDVREERTKKPLVSSFYSLRALRAKQSARKHPGCKGSIFLQLHSRRIIQKLQDYWGKSVTEKIDEKYAFLLQPNLAYLLFERDGTYSAPDKSVSPYGCRFAKIYYLCSLLVYLLNTFTPARKSSVMTFTAGQDVTFVISLMLLSISLFFFPYCYYFFLPCFFNSVYHAHQAFAFRLRTWWYCACN